jgi:uncharacterized protein
VALSLEQGTRLVSIARKSIDSVVLQGRAPTPAELSDWSKGGGDIMGIHRGVFVTLNRLDGELRGCIGVPYPVRPLGEAVVHAAIGAAIYDPRFPPVEAWELDSITVEVSALTEPERIECDTLELPDHVSIGKDGLIVTAPGASGLLLPQVATEMRLTPERFLSLTCQKAGLLADAWLTSDIEVKKFQAEIFIESAPRGLVRQHEMERQGRGQG